MSLLKKILFGTLLGSEKRSQMPSYLRDMPQTGTRRERWVCMFCGRHTYHCGRPPANFGGPCKNSPYGTHRYEEG